MFILQHQPWAALALLWALLHLTAWDAILIIAASNIMLMHAVIPSIEMAAAGLDSIGAIVGFAVCSGIAIPSGSLVYSILSGPLQVRLHLIHQFLVLIVCCACSLVS